MKKLLVLLSAAALVSLASSCVSVKHDDEPTVTRTTSVSPAPAASVSTTTTY